MFGLRLKKFTYKSDDSGKCLSNSALRKMSKDEIREEFQELLEEITEICDNLEKRKKSH